MALAEFLAKSMGVERGVVNRPFSELLDALEAGEVSLHAEIEFRTPKLIATPANGEAATYHKTTAGRVLFNSTLPDAFLSIPRPLLVSGSTMDLATNLARR